LHDRKDIKKPVTLIPKRFFSGISRGRQNGLNQVSQVDRLKQRDRYAGWIIGLLGSTAAKS